jgi:hypothetical protein
MTGGGKTYTISGTPRQPGLLARSLAAIFSHLSKKNIEGNTSGIGQEWAVSVTYVEIYNEAIYDLLSTVGSEQSSSSALGSTAGGVGNNNKKRGVAATSQPNNAFSREQLSILRDREGRGFVSGARQITVSSTEAVFSVLAEGSQNKTHAETALNSDSSRSHTVFSISIWRRDAAAMEQQASIATGPAVIQDIISPKGEVLAGHSLWSRISVVDLAGSERANRVNAGADGATTTKEAGKINNSLMVLMRCFEAMREKKKGAKDVFVRFRDSKLTYMFADYLGGSTSGSTVMIVNAGPGLADYDETLQAIKYAAVVKDVKVSKDRVVTRWEPGQYDKDGRKIKKGGKEATASASTAAALVVGKKGAGKAGSNGADSQLSSTTSSLSTSGPIDLVTSAAISASSSLIAEAAEVAILNANLAAAEEASAAANLAAAEASALLAEANDKIAALEARILELEDETSTLKEEASDLRATSRRLEEEAEDAHERADGIEEDVRDEMAASMEQQMRTVEQLWRAKLEKERTEANDKIAKLLMLQSVKAGKRGSSIAGLLKDLGINASAEAIATAESKSAMNDEEEEEEEEEEDQEEVDEEKQELVKKVDSLEQQLLATTSSLKRAELESSERERLAADARDAAAEAAEAAIEAKGVAASATAKATRAEASLALQIANAEAQSMRFEELENDLKEQAQKVENSLRSDLALLKKQTDAAAIAAEKDIVTLRKEKTESESILQKKLEDEKKEFSGQLSKLTTSLASVTSSRDSYKDEAATWQSKHVALAAAVDGYKGRIVELEERCESFSKSSVALQQRLSAAKSGAIGDEFQAELVEVKSALDRSQQEVVSLRTEIDSLKSEVAETKAKKAESDEKLSSAEEKLAALASIPATTSTSNEISVLFEDFISSASQQEAAAAAQLSQEPELDLAADVEEKPIKEVKKPRSSRTNASTKDSSASVAGVKRSRASSKAPPPAAAAPAIIDEVSETAIEETNEDELVDEEVIIVDEKPARKSRSSRAAPSALIEKPQKASKVARGAGMRDASGATENDIAISQPTREVIASPSKAAIRSVASPRSAGVGPIMKGSRAAPAALKSNIASHQTVAGAAAKKASVTTAKAALVTSDPFEFIASPQAAPLSSAISSMQEEVAPMQSKLKLPMATKRKPVGQSVEVVSSAIDEEAAKPAARSLRARK